MKKIIFIKGQLETLDFFIDKLCIGAEQLKIPYYILNIKNEDCLQKPEFYNFINTGNCIVFMMNQIGLNLITGDKLFWEKYNIPICNFVQDHPYNYTKDLNREINNLNLIVLDKDHELFIDKYYKKPSSIHFLPNGGWQNTETIPYLDRTIDIFYAGSCNPEQPWIKIPFFSDNGENFYTVCFSTLIQNPFLTIEQVIELYCENNNITNFETIKSLIINYGFILMHNIRRYFKLKTMHALEKTGANIVICGDGWIEPNKTWNKNIHLHSRVSSQECNNFSGNAKIGLNFMPWYKNGCSERVFNIMLNSSVCLTDPSEYLLDRFEHGKELVYFNYDDLDGMIADVKYLLDNPSYSQNIANNGFNATINNDTWIHRMNEINNIINNL